VLPVPLLCSCVCTKRGQHVGRSKQAAHEHHRSLIADGTVRQVPREMMSVSSNSSNLMALVSTNPQRRTAKPLSLANVLRSSPADSGVTDVHHS